MRVARPRVVRARRGEEREAVRALRLRGAGDDFHPCFEVLAADLGGGAVGEAGADVVVGVEEDHDVSPAHRETGVERRRLAAVGLQDHVDAGALEETPRRVADAYTDVS